MTMIPTSVFVYKLARLVRCVFFRHEFRRKSICRERFPAAILPGRVLLCSMLLLATAGQAQPYKNEAIVPGEIWKDTRGKAINAHGAGILYHEGVYYWYGEIKSGPTGRVEYVTSWEAFRVNAGGVSCYSSRDLLNWRFEGVVLPARASDSRHDLHVSKVIERPKVIYNERTKKFVMWLHVDKEDYSYSQAGLAVSDKPTGPFRYEGSIKPNGNMSRDMTLFKDDDGKAYLIYASENNMTMHVCLLADDYLSPTPNFRRILVDEHREAPAMFKHAGRYYLITSACTGWSPNAASYAVADHPLGEWTDRGNPCSGPGAETTFMSQGTYVLPIAGRKGEFVFLADRWNKTNLEDSRYLWLPLRMNEKGEPELRLLENWRF